MLRFMFISKGKGLGQTALAQIREHKLGHSIQLNLLNDFSERSPRELVATDSARLSPLKPSSGSALRLESSLPIPKLPNESKIVVDNLTFGKRGRKQIVGVDGVGRCNADCRGRTCLLHLDGLFWRHVEP